MSDRYLDRVLEGTALWTDIDDYVGRWHDTHTNEPLHEFLGLDWEEYRLWVEQPQALRLIIAAHKYDEPLEVVVKRSGDPQALAARGLSSEDARMVRAWLQRTGRLPSP